MRLRTELKMDEERIQWYSVTQ